VFLADAEVVFEAAQIVVVETERLPMIDPPRYDV
jgi:hypothetical protein